MKNYNGRRWVSFQRRVNRLIEEIDRKTAIAKQQKLAPVPVKVNSTGRVWTF